MSGEITYTVEISARSWFCRQCPGIRCVYVMVGSNMPPMTCPHGDCRVGWENDESIDEA